MSDLASTPAEEAAADLAMAAFFFACRSCEYIKVSGPRRTKPIRVGDVQFRQGKAIVPHDSPELHQAETVALIFWDQKNRSKYQTQTAWATMDPQANPVLAWAKVVRCVRMTSRCTEATEVYHFNSDSGAVGIMDSDLMIIKLRAAVVHLGESALGYSPADIGTHSIRSGAAMALVLSGHAAWRIMLCGRWKSSAFLVYIREQVQGFSRGVSQRMTENPDFFHVPDIDCLDLSTSTSTLPTTPASPLEANAFNGGASNNYQVLNVDFFG
jgi:hypothetical protein